MTDTPVLAFSKQLITEQSVTPDTSNALQSVADRLAQVGFVNRFLPFGVVKNLWSIAPAVHSDAPIVAFVGHTDVVPAGDMNSWHTPPFTPVVRDGVLYGRGAADMKTAVAAFTIAAENFLRHTPVPAFRLACLLTGDEEGPAENGTVKVAEHLHAEGTTIDYALVGEPSATDTTGDVVKIGRRGSLGAHITVFGTQGHVAYLHGKDNPNHTLARCLHALQAMTFDDGNTDFPATSMHITEIQSGVGATNVVPQTATARCNFRFSPETAHTTIRQRVETIFQKEAAHYEMTWRLSGTPFYTPKSPLIDATVAAITDTIGTPPQLSTAGGTSDGRFLAPYGTHVVEVGVPNATIHQINECVVVKDIDTLTTIYTEILHNMQFRLPPSPSTKK